MDSQPSRETIIDLQSYFQQAVRVKIAGGRVITGVLKSYDKVPNLVLDEAVEIRTTGDRRLGVVIVRGQHIQMITVEEGVKDTANPFTLAS